MLRVPAAKLRQSGWRLANNGFGSFGAVMRHPDKDYVVKLFSAEDRAYEAFVELAMANPNPHFPRFPGGILREWRDFRVVRIEPLKPIWSADILKFSHLTDLYITSRRDGPDDPAWENIQRARAYVDQQGPHLRQACDLIADHLIGRFNLDLDTRNNVMLRDGTLVFSDPVAVPLAE